jgi:hypothetical protein
MNEAITNFILELLKNAERATGADFSKHKGLWTITESNLPLLIKIMDFLIFRVGYGASDGRVYEDPQFVANYTKAIRWLPRALRGAYWYMSSHSNWTKQFDKFVELLEGKDIHFIVVDFEKYYNQKSKRFALELYEFLRALEKKFPGKRIFIYANYYDYVGWIKSYTNAVDRFPLWIAQYPWKTWTGTLTDWFRKYWTKFIKGEEYLQPKLPAGRGPDDWEIRQMIAASAIGQESGFESDELDFNISRRLKEDFVQYILGEQQLPENPDPVPTVPTPTPVFEDIGEAFVDVFLT